MFSQDHLAFLIFLLVDYQFYDLMSFSCKNKRPPASFTIPFDFSTSSEIFVLIFNILFAFFFTLFKNHVDITTELNVCSSSCHICSYSNSSWYTSVRNNKSFLFVISSIQNLMFYLFFFNIFESNSDFSIDVVPTRTG